MSSPLMQVRQQMPWNPFTEGVMQRDILGGADHGLANGPRVLGWGEARRDMLREYAVHRHFFDRCATGRALSTEI